MRIMRHDVRYMDDITPIDAVDELILGVLQDDARITNRELASRVGLSPSACLARVRALRERGIITGFAAELDLGRLGRPLQALVAIRLHTHARDVLDQFVDDLVELDETLSLFHLTGEADYLLHVAVADPEHLRDVVLDRLTIRPEVAQVTTSLMFEHHRSRPEPIRRSTRRTPRT
ncbi:MAG: transcriptional regulator, AsnC family [Thermoleophilia bacterium]|nr:transcriptional regulator, AsnC family [Thermoleophilia bacterium]